MSEPIVDGARIRTATTADLPHLVELETQASAGRWDRAAFAAELQNPRSTLLAAVDRADLVIGFIVFWCVADEVQLQNMATARSHRRRGVGRALIDRMLRAARAAGATRIDLEVREGNGPAQGLYRQCGFTVVGQREGYYGDTGEAAVLMRLDLDQIEA